MLKFEGSRLFRARLVGSILSNRPVTIAKIREMSETPGLTDYEVDFAQLVDKLTNGTKIVINATGTAVTVNPGYILGGEIEHDCVGRSVGYFLEGVLPLCLFAKRPVRLVLNGITNDDVDINVDILKAVTMRLITKFGMEGLPNLDIVQRGLPPAGKGKIVFTCPIVRQLKAIQLLDPGFVKKVRGVSFGVRISPQILNRIATTTRGIFNELLPDVYINTDLSKARDLNGPSDPGYGLTLFCESTTGCFLGTKRSAIRQSLLEAAEEKSTSLIPNKNFMEAHMLDEAHPGIAAVSDPEEVGKSASHQLLEEISRGGCVDTTHQPLLFLLMCLCPEDVSKARIGKISAYSVAYLRLLHDIFGTVFKLTNDLNDGSIIATCVGVGYKNLSRKVT